MSYISDYVSEIGWALDGCENEVNDLADLVRMVASRNKNIWVLGNGGSMAIAQHFAQDLIKLCGIKAQAMNCPSILTAYSNDECFEMSFYKPISVLSDLDDLILVFSCSGKSRNYIEFVSSFGRRHRIAAVVGTGGGFLKEKVDAFVHVKSSDYQVCETAFCIVADLIIKKLLKDNQ